MEARRGRGRFRRLRTSEKDYCGTRDCETVNASEHIRLTTEAVVSLTARKRILSSVSDEVGQVEFGIGYPADGFIQRLGAIASTVSSGGFAAFVSVR